MAKHKCPEHENHERWLVAFADMMTLLFALFVVLYSIASVEEAKLEEVSKSVQEAFGVSLADYNMKKDRVVPSGLSFLEGVFEYVRGDTAVQRHQAWMKSRQRILMKKLDRLNALLKDSVDEKQLMLSKKAEVSLDPRAQLVTSLEKDHLKISLVLREFFPPGEHQITKSAKEILDMIVPYLEREGVYYHIEGHSDNIPFDQNGITNWELSASRAASVVRYLIEFHKFPSHRLAAVGYAETRPLVPNDTQEQRSLNRRVDLKVFLEEQ
jgi:chemotaxis protein MotB